VSPRELAHLLNTARKTNTKAQSRVEFLRELYWRDFYQYVGWHFPSVLQGMTSPATEKAASCLKYPFANQNFSKEFQGAQIPWNDDAAAEESFELWKQGRTGIPLIDAGMRELAATGFQHNRCRMACAMFLTENMLIDWRVGERYYAQMLTDYDPLSNNGGWQWSSSTGADGSPYFRIMNPMSQLNKCDKELLYVRRWLSQEEIGAIEQKDLLKWEEDKVRAKYQGIKAKAEYRSPIVDLKKTREAAIAAFKFCRKNV
jgi:deoxyribodipyrimidine photo-lyase